MSFKVIQPQPSIHIHISTMSKGHQRKSLFLCKKVVAKIMRWCARMKSSRMQVRVPYKKQGSRKNAYFVNAGLAGPRCAKDSFSWWVHHMLDSVCPSVLAAGAGGCAGHFDPTQNMKNSLKGPSTLQNNWSSHLSYQSTTKYVEANLRNDVNYNLTSPI